MMKLALTALLAGIALPASAATILGVNFNNNDSAGSQNNGNFGATWTNLGAGSSGSGTSVSGGAGATLGWASANYWGAGSWMSSTSGNAFNTPIGLMRAYLDDGDNPAAGSPTGMGAVNGDGVGASVSISGLSAWLAAEGATGYIIRAFFSTDTASATFRPISVRDGLSVTSTALETITPTVQGNGNWDGTTVDAGGNNSAGTRGDALFGTTFNQNDITLTVQARSGSSRGGLAGFIITAVPEPSTAVLGLTLIPLLARRRRA